MSNEEKIDIFKKCVNKTEAYKMFNICPNSYGVLKLKTLAQECGFDLNYYKDNRLNSVCLHCGKIFVKKEKKQTFCCRSCSAIFNNKNNKKYLTVEQKESKRIETNIKNKEYKVRIKKCKICPICGSNPCLNLEICNHNKHWFNRLICFGLDQSKIGTSEIYVEYTKVKKLLYDEYFIHQLSPHDICEKYRYDKTSENLLHLLKKIGFKTRTISESVLNAVLQGKQNIKINRNTNYQYKHGYHETWNGKIIYYRSSYELDYAKILDSKSIDYDVECFRFKYWDSQRSKYRIAIPDFYLRQYNKIVEIKSKFTFNKQNILDKFKEYAKLGYDTELLMENKVYKYNQVFELK